jgi:hypothetical protein
VCSCQAFDGIGGAIIDFNFAGVFQNHPARENHTAPETVEFMCQFGLENQFRLICISPIVFGEQFGSI